METPKKTYIGEQYDTIEKLLDDAEKLMEHPHTRKEGHSYMKLAEVRIKREMNRIIYARQTGQAPHIPPLEPAKDQKLLKE